MLAVRKLDVAYGQSQVIRGLDMDVGHNEIVAVLGRNGMGKTTLFKALMGILPARGGQVAIDSIDVTAMAPHRRVENGIAYVPQGRMIFPSLTVRENIETGLETAREKKIPDDIYGLFPVLFEMRNRKGGNLSGGQQQQLAIARALVSEPRVLLLDEPTEGIQPSIIKDIARVLKEIRKMRELTIIVSEQVLHFALDVADRIAVIERGAIVYEGARGEVDAAHVSRYLAV
ncbi:MAG: urea ABC transporter ATP-binding subunit UrtE [Gammaproteobacteria bacterium]|nr:urea ABC transporter ATP-binding subunit UrtE [Gammaproteobacteria bacterium]MCP5200108.1 urea ABC transporter ATP-binding subunit UrtE [Gammaproteobacteria bacterium]